MTLEEFEELSPSGYYALTKRRDARIKHDRFANAQTAAAVYNVNRVSEDSPTVQAFDFIRDDASARRIERKRKATRFIQRVIGDLPRTTTIDKYQAVRLSAIKDLTASGHVNAEELFDSVWPHIKHLKPAIDKEDDE